MSLGTGISGAWEGDPGIAVGISAGGLENIGLNVGLDDVGEELVIVGGSKLGGGASGELGCDGGMAGALGRDGETGKLVAPCEGKAAG